MPADPNALAAGIPDDIGGYQIQRILGSGGMATVYAALQKQPRRTVAVKVMREAIQAEVANRRFKREIEILGRLRHPYIAQVYAAGVHVDGDRTLPYFVMEYVPGARTIIEHAEERGLSIRERLKLFVKICAAVEHGHRNKIIHRDLKPGNILIDEGGDPKVIDFGVARAVELDVTSQTMHTEEGRLIGTIQYMAPEQLESTRQDLDARCDVYALGVLLYKLTVGRHPHELRGLPVFTAAQVIREDPPPRPGTLQPDLKGDLETIMLRALAKDRARRYPSAGSLGRDLLRFLADKPIKARDASLAYRLRLFLRRHRTESIAAALVGVVIIVAAAVVVGQRIMLKGDAPPPVERPDPAPGMTAAPAPVTGTTPPEASSPDVETPAREALVLDPEGSRPTALAFDPAGRLLASATEDLTIRWWDIETGEALITTGDHDAPVRLLAFDGRGRRLASIDDEGMLVIVERAGTGSRMVLREPGPRSKGLALSPAGDRVALSSDDLTVRLLTDEGDLVTAFRGSDGAFQALAFNHDGALLAAGSAQGGVYVWDTRDRRRIARFTDLEEPTVAIGFSPDDGRLGAATISGRGAGWTLTPEPARVASFAVSLPDLVAVAMDPGGQWAFAASGQRVRLVSLSGGRGSGATIEHEGAGEIGAFAVAPGGRWCALGAADGGIRVVPITTP